MKVNRKVKINWKSNFQKAMKVKRKLQKVRKLNES